MADHVSDATLIERFVHLREEDAFVALVRRHGPSVLRVCRRLLRNQHDIEDVFQSTFLVLALKASRITWRDSVDAWLRDVARRLALNARARTARREVREGSLFGASESRSDPTVDPLDPRETDPGDEVDRREMRSALDVALQQLPEKYRTPVILCYLEGKTNEEAARQLGWPAGSMSRRLERGRTLLRQRLSRQGLTLAVGALFMSSLFLLGTRAVDRGPVYGRADFAPIREAMARFKPESQSMEGFGDLLTRLTSGGRSRTDREEVETLAEKARQTAIFIEDFNPGRDRPLWRATADEMRQAASELSRTVRGENTLAMVVAARRLDATCVRCHDVFREEGASHRSKGAQ